MGKLWIITYRLVLVCKFSEEKSADCIRQCALWVFVATQGSLKNNFTFYTPMHPAWLRCESSEYPDIPAFSRLARRAPHRLKL
jgi:hypothetical protein